MTPLRSLVQAHLQPFDSIGRDGAGQRLAIFDDARAMGSEAVAGVGSGLDHYAGERVLAAAMLHHSHRDHFNRLAWAITDRRTLVRGYSNQSSVSDYSKHCYAVAHDELVAAQADLGILSKTVILRTAREKIEFPLDKLAQSVGGLYQALLGCPPPRREPPTAFPAPCPEDPTGAQAALPALWFQDGAAAKMLALVSERSARGELQPGVAADLVRRIVILNRMNGGPGAWGTAWLSPLHAADFGEAVTWSLGRPVNLQNDAQGFVLDFRLEAGAGAPLVTAARALGVASYFTLGIGFSPTRVVGRAVSKALLKKESVTTIRVGYAPVEGGTSFVVYGNGSRPIEQIEPLLALCLHSALHASSYRVLSLRAEFGIDRPLTELVAMAGPSTNTG